MSITHWWRTIILVIGTRVDGTCFSSSNSTSTSSSIWGETAVTTNIRRRTEVLFTCVRVPPSFLVSFKLRPNCVNVSLTATHSHTPCPPSPFITSQYAAEKLSPQKELIFEADIVQQQQQQQSWQGCLKRRVMRESVQVQSALAPGHCPFWAKRWIKRKRMPFVESLLKCYFLAAVSNLSNGLKRKSQIWHSHILQWHLIPPVLKVSPPFLLIVNETLMHCPWFQLKYSLTWLWCMKPGFKESNIVHTSYLEFFLSAIWNQRVILKRHYTNRPLLIILHIQLWDIVEVPLGPAWSVSFFQGQEISSTLLKPGFSLLPCDGFVTSGM